MVKTAKSTKDDIEKRQQLILDLIKHNKTYKMKKSLLVDLNSLLSRRGLKKITEATIGRDFEDLGIKKLPGNDYYEYPHEIRQKHELESLSRDLRNHTNRIFMDDISFLVIQVEEGMADYVGRKIMAQFKSFFIGYFPGSDFLLLITNDETKLADAKKQLKKLCES